MKRIYALLLSLLMVSMLLSACGAPTTAENSETTTQAATAAAPETTAAQSEAEAEEEDDPNPAVVDNRNFGSLEDLSDLVDDAIELLDEATSEVDDFSVMGQTMPVYSVNATIVMSTLLDHAFNGSQESYSYAKTPMASGAGEYEGSLEKEGTVYTWRYNSYLNEGTDTYLTLTYDLSKNFVEIVRDGNESQTSFAHNQIYQYADDAFTAVVSEFDSSNKKMSQVVLMGSPGVVKYGYRVVDSEEITLPVNLAENSATTWDALLNGVEYDFILTYDGDTLEYTGQ